MAKFKDWYFFVLWFFYDLSIQGIARLHTLHVGRNWNFVANISETCTVCQSGFVLKSSFSQFFKRSFFIKRRKINWETKYWIIFDVFNIIFLIKKDFHKAKEKLHVSLWLFCLIFLEIILKNLNGLNESWLGIFVRFVGYFEYCIKLDH